MSVEELRAWLGIEEHELRPVKDLRQRAIDVSKAELDKKADLSFTYTPTKVGRRITGWTFKVRKNQVPPVQRQLHLVLDQEPERTTEATTKGLAALAECKREVEKAPVPVARITRGSRV
jgi:plasmid replication initiation protein